MKGTHPSNMADSEIQPAPPVEEPAPRQRELPSATTHWAILALLITLPLLALILIWQQLWLSPDSQAAPQAGGEHMLEFPGEPLASVEIRYHQPEAGKVILVWGVEGWNLLPESAWPAETRVRSGSMHTVLQKQEDDFVTTLNVPAGWQVDYGFLIMARANGDLLEGAWDEEDTYPNITAADGQVVEIESSLSLDPVPPSLIEQALIASFLLIILQLMFTMYMHTRYTPRALIFYLVVLVGLALILRLGMSLQWNLTHPNSAKRLVGDEPGFNNLAWSILSGRGYGGADRVPLYPVMLAVIFAITGGSYNAVTYFQAFLGAASILLVFILGREVFGRAAGLVAAFLTAVSFVLINQSVHLLSEVLYTPAVLITAITLWIAFHHPSKMHFFWAGVWVGISNLIRPALLFFPLLALAAFLLVMERRKAIQYWLVFTLASLMVVAPWITYNAIRYKAIFPLQTSNAFFFLGSPEYYHLTRDQGMSYVDVWDKVIYGPDGEAHPPYTVEGDRWWTRRALESVAEEPLLYLQFSAQKLVTYWLGDPWVDWAGSHVFDYGALRRYGYSYQQASFLMLARVVPILALAGIFLVRRRWKSLLPIYSILLYATLIHAMAHAEARLSEPLQPLLFILIAGGLVNLLDQYLPVSSSIEYLWKSA